ncbi:MAG: PKD domain-containing protein [Bacteroidota bacterium]
MQLRCIFFILFFSGIHDLIAQCPVTIAPPGSTNICSGNSVSLLASGTGSWLWSPATGLNATTGSTVSASPSITTTYTVTRTCPDLTTGTASVSVVVNPKPTPSISFNPNSAKCSGTAIIFSVPSPQGGATYAWNFGDGTTGSGTSVSHAFSALGNGNTPFTVTVTATFTSTGCTATASTTVTVKKRPEAVLVDLVNTPEFINCNGGTFSLSVGDGAVNTYTNYLISWGDGSTNYTSTIPPSTSPGVPHSYSTLGFKTILYTVTNSNGCTTTSTYSAFNGGNPQVGLANPGGTTGLCTPTTLSFPISNYSNNAPGTIYVVTTNDGTPADTFQHPPPTSYVHQFTKTSCGSTSPGYPNSFYVRIEAINPCASSSATVEPITTNALPNVDFSISPDSIACVNSTVTFTNTSFGGAWVNAQNQCDTTKISNWKITPSTGYTVTSGSFGNNPPSVNLPGTWGSGALGVAFNTIGSYSIKLRVRTKNACGYDTIVKTVCIQPVPVPAFSLNSIIGCAPLSITATNSSNTLNTCSPATYGWTVTYVASNCGTASAFSFTNSTSASSISPSFVFTNPGTYTITLSVTNKCGVFTTLKTVTVKEKPSVVVSTSPPSACSSPASTTPMVTATNCGANAMTYAWTFAGGAPATSGIANPGSISFSSVGAHAISVSVTNECGTTVGTTPFTISTIPNPPVVANISPVCIGDSIHLFASTVAGASYNWTGPSGFTSTLQNPGIGNAQLANAGSYSVTITVNGCTSSPASKTVTVNPLPVVVVNSPSICIGQSATLTASGANTYAWIPNTNISGITGASITANPTSTISYTVTGTNTTTGCKNTSVSLVTVKPLPVVNAGPSITLCNQPVPNTLTGFSPAGGTWTGAGVSSAGVFTPSASGIFILTYSYSDGSCSNQDTMKVTVIAPQTVNAGTGFAICENIAAQTLTGFTPAGGTWSGAGMTGNSFDPAAAGPGIHILTYSLGAGTCLTSDTIKVNVKASPTVVVNSPTICAGETVILTASGANTYSWAPNTNLTAVTGASVSANPGSSISYTVTGTTSLTGCTKTAVSNVTVNPLPVVNAGPSITLCNQPIPNTLTGFSPAGGTWTGAGVTGAGVFTPSTVGNFILTYSFTSLNCTNQDSLIITVVTPQTANAGTGYKTCVNAPIQTLSGYTPSGGTWTGPSITGNTFNPATAGIGMHILTYSFGTGTCLSTDTIRVTVNSAPVVTVNSALFCSGDSSTLTAGGANTYVWGPSTGLNLSTGASVIAFPTTTTIYTVTGTVTATGCSATAPSTITVNPLPVVNAGASILLCDQPIAYTLTGFSPTTGGSGAWTGAGVTAAGIYTPHGVVVDVLTYTFTDLNTCVNSDTIKVTVVTPQVAEAGANDTLCLNNGLFNLSGFSPLAGTWTGVGISSPGGVFDPLIAGVGTHLLTLSYGAGTCFTTDTKKITVKPIPVINPGANEITCISDPEYILPGFSPTGGTWAGNGITNGTTGAFDPAVANIGTSTLTYSFTDPVTHCTNTGIKTITVGALPVVAFSKALSECVNIPVLFTNSTTGASNYQWDFGDGGTSTAVSPSHSYTSAGTFTIKLVSYSVLGCTDSLSDTIHIIAPPSSGFTVVSDTGCAPLLTDFNNTSTGLFCSYSWSYGNGNMSALKVPVAQTYLQGLYDTTYYVTLTVTNLCGVSTKTNSVFVMPTPVVNFGTNVNSGCSPLLITMNNNSTGNASQYIWNYGDGSATVSAINPPSHIFTTGVNDTIYKIRLIGSNTCGADTITKSILVHPNTINAFFNTSSISGCSPHTVTFSDFSSGGTFISWDFGDGNVTTSTNAVHTYLTAGTYICRQFVNNGCSYDTAMVSITVYPPPTLSFTADVATVCVNQAVTFNNTSTNSVNFAWNFGDGDSSILTNPSHSYTNSGNYTVLLIGTSTTFGCIDTISQPVSVNTAVIPQISSNALFGCEPFIAAFSNTSQNALFYSWDFNDGNGSVFAAPVHTFSAAGVYNVNMVAQSLNGCKDSAQIQINVYPNPAASFSLSSLYSCLVPATVNFTDNSTGANGYQWDFGNGGTSVLTNPSTIYNTVGQFSPTLITSNTFGCLDTAINTFTVYATPIAAFSPSLTGGCEPLTISFANQSQNGLSYSWSFGDGGTSATSSPDHIFQNPGNYSVTLITNNGLYCADTLQYASNFTVNPKPFADFSVNQVYTSGIPVGTLQYLNSSVNANSYLWNFGDGNSSNTENPQHQYNVFGTYTTTLITTNQFGCIDTAQKNVNPDYFQGLFVPNAMMPNFESSEANLFLPKGKSLKTYHLQIFNSWGTLLFESTALDASGSPSEGWNGVFEGKECPQDVYVWEIDATFVNGNFWFGKLYPNGKFSNTGTVTLIK